MNGSISTTQPKEPGMTSRELNPDRFGNIAREVYEFLAASDFADDFDAAGIAAAVAAVANSVDDLSMDEFNTILEANDRSTE